jgi:hypothetical protein
MNRVLKRPMFRIGGSAGTGITSGLDQPQKMANGGRTGYANGTPNSFASNLMPGTIPGFLTSFGLDLLSRPPQGGLFSTIAASARGPLEQLQANQVESMKTASDRAFARELAAEEREFEEGQLEKKLATQKEIAGMDTTDATKRIQDIADTKYEGNTIKAQREVDFATTTYPNLVDNYGEESVATDIIDSSTLQKPRDVERFVKANPTLARQVVYDVATGKPMRFVKDQTGKFILVPASSEDIDTTGEAMPDPDRTPGLFGQKTKPNIVGPAIKRLGEEFSDDFYQGG